MSVILCVASLLLCVVGGVCCVMLGMFLDARDTDSSPILSCTVKMEGLAKTLPSDIGAYAGKLAEKLRLLNQLCDSVREQEYKPDKPFIRIDAAGVLNEAHKNVKMRVDASIALALALKNIPATQMADVAGQVCETFEEVSGYISAVIGGLGTWLSDVAEGKPISEELVSAVINPAPPRRRVAKPDTSESN